MKHKKSYPRYLRERYRQKRIDAVESILDGKQEEEIIWPTPWRFDNSMLDFQKQITEMITAAYDINIFRK